MYVFQLPKTSDDSSLSLFHGDSVSLHLRASSAVGKSSTTDFFFNDDIEEKTKMLQLVVSKLISEYTISCIYFCIVNSKWTWSCFVCLHHLGTKNVILLRSTLTVLYVVSQISLTTCYCLRTTEHYHHLISTELAAWWRRYWDAKKNLPKVFNPSWSD